MEDIEKKTPSKIIKIKSTGEIKTPTPKKIAKVIPEEKDKEMKDESKAKPVTPMKAPAKKEHSALKVVKAKEKWKPKKSVVLEYSKTTHELRTILIITSKEGTKRTVKSRKKLKSNDPPAPKAKPKEAVKSKPKKSSSSKKKKSAGEGFGSEIQGTFHPGFWDP